MYMKSGEISIFSDYRMSIFSGSKISQTMHLYNYAHMHVHVGTILHYAYALR